MREAQLKVFRGLKRAIGVSLEVFRGLNVVRDEQLKVFRGLKRAIGVSLEQFRGLNVVRDEQLKVFRGLNAAAHGARRQLLFAIIAIIVADITIDNTRSQSKFLRTPKSITAR